MGDAAAPCRAAALFLGRKENFYDEQNTQAGQGWRDGHRAAPSGRGPCEAPYHGHGITKGASIFVRKVAPLGDPMEVTVRGYELSLRKDDAGLILVD